MINLTPHPIRVMRSDGELLMEIPPSGQLARVSPTSVEAGELGGVPLVRTTFGEVSGLPEPDGETIYIVSSIVAQAVSGRDDVVAPDTGPTAIRTPEGQIAGVTRFQTFS